MTFDEITQTIRRGKNLNFGDAHGFKAGDHVALYGKETRNFVVEQVVSATTVELMSLEAWEGNRLFERVFLALTILAGALFGVLALAHYFGG